MKTFSGHTGNVRSVSFSPDGKYIASGSWDGTMRIWKVETGENVYTYREYLTPQISISFSPDGEYIASGTYDGSVILWYARIPKPFIPSDYALYQNYPNPFNLSTTIEFDLPERTYVKLSVYDILGREVEVLVDEVMLRGRRSVPFDAGNLSSGVYFYRINTGKLVQAKKMVVLR